MNRVRQSFITKYCAAAVALVATAFAATTAQAAVPSDGWHAEAMTADGSSVYNDGETVWAWAGGAADTSTIGEITVNGVTFKTVKSLSNKPSGLSLPFSFNHALSYDGSGWGSESVTDVGYKQMLSTGWWRDNYGTSGITYTLSGLEVGEKYLIQAVYHRSNESCTITLAGLADTIKISGDNWKYGGTFVGVVTATATTYSFTITTDVSNRQYLNALQLRKLGGSDPVAPSVGSMTAKGGLKGKVTLANVVKGTNDDGSEKATSYSVFYRLGDGEAVTALTGQTGTTATFGIDGLTNGTYTVSAWITTDKNRSTEAQSATFTIDSTQPSWTATPMSATGDTILTEGTLVYAYGHYGSTSTRTVNGVTFDICDNLSSLSDIKVKPNLQYSNSGFGDMGVTGDYGDMLKYAFWYNQSGDFTYTLNGLEKGAGYVVQVVVHRDGNNYKIYAPDEETCIQLGKDGEWTYGGALTCEFTATNTAHSFVLNYGGNAILNAIQVRKIKDAPPPVTDPEIGSVSAKTKGAKATVSLADVVMGTDDAGEAAALYTINWTLSGQEEREGTIADQTASSVSFEIDDLTDGNYTCEVSITTDKAKTSAAKSAVFTVNSTIGDFDALKSAIEGAEFGDTITVAKGYYYATSAISVSKRINIVSAVGAAQTIIDGGYPDNAFVLLDVNVEGVKVSGLTFKNSGGSAIDVDNKVYGFEVTDCVFENCHAATGAGVNGSLMYAEHGAQSSSVFPPRGDMGVISGCAFKNCAANGTSDCGGAVAGPFWIENSAFDGCSSERFAPVVFTAQNMMVTNCVFKNSPMPSNHGRSAIYQNRAVALRVIDCKFSGMTCHALFGGTGGANILVDRCDIENCTGAETLDSDINYPYALFYGGDGVVRNTLIHANKNPFKLGNQNYQNCTIAGNVGGLFVPYDSNQNRITASFTNCVFASNAKWPASAYWRGDAGLQWHGGNENICSAIAFANCILEGASNSSSGLHGLLSQDPTGASATLTANADEIGVRFKDPSAGDWTAKSGKSPLVDGGVLCDGMSDERDLNGAARVRGEGPDVGCYEYRPKAMSIIIR